MNQILASPELWEPASRQSAGAKFDIRIVDIFFDGLEPTLTDSRALRDETLPFPEAVDGYRTVLLLGTTGAGKTTLVRQLIGTDPQSERFPSTSTAKTTIADNELIFTKDREFSAVVTFVGRDEVLEHLNECLVEAALAVFRRADDREVRRKLLDHPDQRFRFSYVLGRSSEVHDDDYDDDDYVDDDDSGLEAEEVRGYLGDANEVLESAVKIVQQLVEDHETVVREEVGDDEADERVLSELMEETLDEYLRRDDRFHEISDRIFDEIEKRFDLLTDGTVRRNRQGWPEAWIWSTDDRSLFFKTVTRFSSNYAPFFGTLLTPLVNGIRVKGPFAPDWTSVSTPELVLIDGEGLGHTPTSAAALSTEVSKRIEEVDAVVLVDNAMQPMQAAPVAAMKAIVTSGNAGKLVFCFTHFDLVKGANLPTFSDREDHVRASAENVLKAIGEDLGPFAERVLRQRLNESFFLGGIDESLDISRKIGRRTIDQLSQLLQVIDHIVDRPEASAARPSYDRANLVLAIRAAAETFHEAWHARLGLETGAGATKEHWTRIKALSRRLAEGWANEYDKLKPVAELKRDLEEQIYRMLQNPIEWTGNPSEEEKQQVVDDFANAIATELQILSERRINLERVSMWRDAYAPRGRGSTSVRAEIIDHIYDRGAPIPSVTPSPDRNKFLREVTDVVETLAQEMEIGLV